MRSPPRSPPQQRQPMPKYNIHQRTRPTETPDTTRSVCSPTHAVPAASPSPRGAPSPRFPLFADTTVPSTARPFLRNLPSVCPPSKSADLPLTRSRNAPGKTAHKAVAFPQPVTRGRERPTPRGSEEREGPSPDLHHHRPPCGRPHQSPAQGPGPPAFDIVRVDARNMHQRRYQACGRSGSPRHSSFNISLSGSFPSLPPPPMSRQPAPPGACAPWKWCVPE
ncbi:hypothetical protein BC628DRAFT_990828 [Trametes gibbosa]|nr:hypothetical protein BC628DRAFT_990828 [Trametes gibbosa]